MSLMFLKMAELVSLVTRLLARAAEKPFYLSA